MQFNCTTTILFMTLSEGPQPKARGSMSARVLFMVLSDIKQKR